MGNLPEQPWLTLEGNRSAEEYMFNQGEELKSLQETVARLFDGRMIRYWDFDWDEQKKCWTIAVYPDKQVDIGAYYSQGICIEL